MKKNKMLRIASVMLVLALITTCVISGTFAKYLTKKSTSDSARVAKWGVGMEFDENNTDLFLDTYGEFVISEDGVVVAPGLSSDAYNLTKKINISGAPEVKCEFTFRLDVNSDVTLNGTFADPTDEDGAATFTVTNYRPVKFTISGTIAGETINETGSLTDLASTFADKIITYTPGTSSLENNSLTISWAWDGSEAGNNEDAADTVLGNQAVDNDLEVDYKLVLIATQITA